MRPVHVLLLVGDRVPPHVEQAVGPCAAPDKEGAEIEARAVLREDEVDGVRVAVANRGTHFGVEVGVGERVGDVEGVVFVDVAVDVLFEVVEHVVLKRIGRFHDVTVEVKPPDPII